MYFPYSYSCSMVGYIKVISSLLLVYIVSLNTTNENKEINNEYKGHGQICLTWGGIDGTSILGAGVPGYRAYLLYLLRFSPEYKYFFNRYLGIVPRFGVLDGWYYSSAYDCHSILSLGVGLEWSYNGTGSNSRINKTYYGGSIGVFGLWGNTIDGNSNKFTFEPNKWGVQVRLTPFKKCKPNGFYMSVDAGCVDIRGFGSNDWVRDGIIGLTIGNMAFNIGWSWWI